MASQGKKNAKFWSRGPSPGHPRPTPLWHPKPARFGETRPLRPYIPLGGRPQNQPRISLIRLFSRFPRIMAKHVNSAEIENLGKEPFWCGILTGKPALLGGHRNPVFLLIFVGDSVSLRFSRCKIEKKSKILLKKTPKCQGIPVF